MGRQENIYQSWHSKDGFSVRNSGIRFLIIKSADFGRSPLSEPLQNPLQPYMNSSIFRALLFKAPTKSPCCLIVTDVQPSLICSCHRSRFENLNLGVCAFQLAELHIRLKLPECKRSFVAGVSGTFSRQQRATSSPSLFYVYVRLWILDKCVCGMCLYWKTDRQTDKHTPPHIPTHTHRFKCSPR
jgi:hypothetical protein